MNADSYAVIHKAQAPLRVNKCVSSSLESAVNVISALQYFLQLWAVAVSFKATPGELLRSSTGRCD